MKCAEVAHGHQYRIQKLSFITRFFGPSQCRLCLVDLFTGVGGDTDMATLYIQLEQELLSWYRLFNTMR